MQIAKNKSFIEGRTSWFVFADIIYLFFSWHNRTALSIVWSLEPKLEKLKRSSIAQRMILRSF